MNHEFFKVSKSDFNTTMDCSFELIKQEYDQQDQALNNENEQELMLFIDKSKRQFFFTDASNMQLCKEIIKDKYNSEITETNLKEIKSWQRKPAKA